MRFNAKYSSTIRSNRRRGRASIASMSMGGVFFLIVAIGIAGVAAYNFCRIDVPAMHIAVLTKKTGKDMGNGSEVAPSDEYKGVQLNVLSEGRYFYNPYHYDWDVHPMVDIPQGKMGVRVRLYGNDLPYGDFVVPNSEENKVDPEDNYKGIVQDVLRPARYAINALLTDENGKSLNGRERKKDYLEIIELHDPITIPAGYKGVVTNLSGPMPEDSNEFLVPTGFRGVQEATLDEGTYYLNPYMYRVQKIDTRSQRFNLADNDDMGFPSKDGFWVSLDGIIEFRVKPEKAALVYVLYDESNNDSDGESSIDQEIIRKVIMPNARSFCRLQGSNSSGRDFIDGETRSAFQATFESVIRETCEEQGIEILQALITKINPPQAIAEPVRLREVASQQLKQYNQEKLQQDEEAKLAKEVALVKQRQELVGAEKDVVKLVTEAQRRQDVALAEASRDKEVAVEELAAAKDLATAILAEKRAEAAVIGFQNTAEAAGWKAAVAALDGDGDAYARYFLYQKLAPGFKSIMTNTADSPLMDIFNNFSGQRRGDAGNNATPPSSAESSQDE